MSAGAGWGSRSQRQRSLSREVAAFASVQPRREVRGGRARGDRAREGVRIRDKPGKAGKLLWVLRFAWAPAVAVA